MMWLSKKHHNSCEMNATRRDLILQRWNTIQHELLPQLREQVGALTPKLERVIHILEWVRIEDSRPRRGAAWDARRTNWPGWPKRSSPRPCWD